MFTEQELSSRNSGEKNLWSLFLFYKINDAMGCFAPPEESRFNHHKNIPSLQEQYDEKRQELIKSGRTLKHRSQLQGRWCGVARGFLESSSFDEVCLMIDHDTDMVNRAFAMVQEAITLEKKLFDEFKKKDKQCIDTYKPTCTSKGSVSTESVIELGQ